MRFCTFAAALILAPAAAMAADCNRPSPVTPSPGATSTTIASGPATGSLACYGVTVNKDQVLAVAVDSPREDTFLALYAPGWTASCTGAGDCEITGDQLSEADITNWSDAVETSGQYLIVIDNSRSDSEYRLTVEIE